ncbi:MAG: MBL fold metallo-hydrolase, partial [Candidatus Lokiarchaeota archaeon]|nr:MBL fold metallo-hydrolase [Candidatus Lokiarchaeota archaeon]
MNVRVTNIYNNFALEKKGFKADWGNSFLIETPEEKILYDCGYKGDILLNNMKLVKCHPNDIDLLIFSHGHNDHTYGLKKLLFERTTTNKLPIIAHPDALKKKRLRFPVNIILGEKEIGFPTLLENLKAKTTFQLLREPTQIRPFLSTVGEVKKRPE